MNAYQGGVCCEENVVNGYRRTISSVQIQNLFTANQDLHVLEKSLGELPSVSNFIPPLNRHEKPVIGSFVDPSVVSGFMYRVRVNGTVEYLFDGQSRYLKSIGEGYSRQLTFESEELVNETTSIMSDGSSTGYAFSIDVLKKSEEFLVFEHEKQIGSAVVLTASDEQEIVQSQNENDFPTHMKVVQVNFTCRFNLPQLQNAFISEVAGLVCVKKAESDGRHVVKEITSLLLPSGKVLTLKPKP